MSTEPKPDSPAELAAEIRRKLSDFARACAFGSDDARIECGCAIEADLSRLAAIATIQASASASQEPVAHLSTICTADATRHHADPHAHWIPSADGLSRRNPAPDAAQAGVPNSVTVALTAATQARPASGEARDDWVMVPKEATEAMFRAGLEQRASKHNGLPMIYAAMIAAAPTSTPSAAKKD